MTDKSALAYLSYLLFVFNELKLFFV